MLLWAIIGFCISSFPHVLTPRSREHRCCTYCQSWRRQSSTWCLKASSTRMKRLQVVTCIAWSSAACSLTGRGAVARDRSAKGLAVTLTIYVSTMGMIAHHHVTHSPRCALFIIDAPSHMLSTSLLTRLGINTLTNLAEQRLRRCAHSGTPNIHLFL